MTIAAASTDRPANTGDFKASVNAPLPKYSCNCAGSRETALAITISQESPEKVNGNCRKTHAAGMELFPFPFRQIDSAPRDDGKRTLAELLYRADCGGRDAVEAYLRAYLADVGLFFHDLVLHASASSRTISWISSKMR
ncbi:MAG: hypothetical protein KGJ79_15100 [Alphaproteobacteria bacterium]|nr:hypothetical protein [Alphaproteobacteria bacterium]MDE2493991.1 hypothetical protein [Alphaproteobacteria bacterium]